MINKRMREGERCVIDGFIVMVKRRSNVAHKHRCWLGMSTHGKDLCLLASAHLIKYFK